VAGRCTWIYSEAFNNFTSALPEGRGEENEAPIPACYFEALPDYGLVGWYLLKKYRHPTK
jgi:hypothetical protein